MIGRIGIAGEPFTDYVVVVRENDTLRIDDVVQLTDNDRKVRTA